MKILRNLALLMTLMNIAAPAFAVGQLDKQLQFVIADTRPCVFFTLQGVQQADPVNPNQPWFALPTSHPMFQQILAMLLTAKMSQAHIDVYTTGVPIATCDNFVGVGGIWLK